MLENIKFLLNLNDDKYDKLLLFYIKRFENLVLDYCNISELNPVLSGFIEDKVIKAVRSKVEYGNESGVPSNDDGKIKAITRGDTRIEYNVSNKSSDSSSSSETSSKDDVLSKGDMKILNQFRKLRK